MRQDQIDELKPQYREITESIFEVMLSSVGVTSIEDVLPNPDEFIEGMIKSAYSEGFTEKDIDTIIKFNKKYEKKNITAKLRSQIFVEKYFEENIASIEAHFSKFKGE